MPAMHSSSRMRIDSAVERSPLVAGALAAAEEAHANQKRETGGSEIALLDHLTAVAERVAAEGYDDEALAAALLHDAVEREALELGEVRERFGAEVAGIVAALTEDASIEDYEERKEEHRRRVAEAGPEARAVFAADKTVNVALLREAYRQRQEQVDEFLAVPLDRKIVIWEYDLEMLFDELPGALADGLADQLVGLWKQRAEEEERLGTL